MDEQEKYHELWDAVAKYLKALGDQEDMLTILEARAKLARLVNYTGEEDG